MLPNESLTTRRIRGRTESMRPGASPGQTKWGGQYGWGVGGLVGYGIQIQSEAYQYAPCTTTQSQKHHRGKKWGDVSTPVHSVATPLHAACILGTATFLDP